MNEIKDNRLTTGTTVPIYIPLKTKPKEIRPGEAYFIVKERRTRDLYGRK